jgi:hypothetical protein
LKLLKSGVICIPNGTVDRRSTVNLSGDILVVGV